MMELNARNPYFWDWDNLMFNTKSIEEPKNLEFVESGIDIIEKFEVGSLCSSGGCSDGGTCSDLGYASSSRSLNSASVDSFTDGEIKGTKFSLETYDSSQPDFRCKREMIGSEPIESSESLIALELGINSIPRDSTAKRSKSSPLNAEIPWCQVEGCNLDLSSAKNYHRKHRVCESHSKSPKVVINGTDRRFCQQCSRFHGLLEFDQKKRSCRERLSDHNARRRKPKPEVIQYNSMRLGSSLYEGGNQLSFSFDQAPVNKTTHGHGNWDNTVYSKDRQVKPGLFTAVYSGRTDEPHVTYNGLERPESGTKLSPVSTQLLTSKSTPSDVFQRDLQVSMAPSNLSATQDLRAPSLLSTSCSSWGSCEPQPSPLDPRMDANHPCLAAQPLPTVAVGGAPPVSSVYWPTEPPASSGPESHSSAFQLFKAPKDSSFYLY